MSVIATGRKWLVNRFESPDTRLTPWLAPVTGKNTRLCRRARKEPGTGKSNPVWQRPANEQVGESPRFRSR